jgi:hypothetical protein
MHDRCFDCVYVYLDTVEVVLTSHPMSYEQTVSELNRSSTSLLVTDIAALRLGDNDMPATPGNALRGKSATRVTVGRLVLKVRHLSLSHIQQNSQAIQVKVPNAYSHPLSGLRGAWYGLTLPHSVQMLLDILNTQPQHLSGYLALRDVNGALAFIEQRVRSNSTPAHPPQLAYEIAFDGLGVTEKILLLSVLSRRCIELQYDMEAESVQQTGRDNFGVTLEEINQFGAPTGMLTSDMHY